MCSRKHTFTFCLFSPYLFSLPTAQKASLRFPFLSPSPPLIFFLLLLFNIPSVFFIPPLLFFLLFSFSSSFSFTSFFLLHIFLHLFLFMLLLHVHWLLCSACSKTLTFKSNIMRWSESKAACSTSSRRRQEDAIVVKALDKLASA